MSERVKFDVAFMHRIVCHIAIFCVIILYRIVFPLGSYRANIIIDHETEGHTHIIPSHCDTVEGIRHKQHVCITFVASLYFIYLL